MAGSRKVSSRGLECLGSAAGLWVGTVRAVQMQGGRGGLHAGPCIRLPPNRRPPQNPSSGGKGNLRREKESVGAPGWVPGA